MNGFARRYLLKIGCGLSVAAVSFSLSLYLAGTPVTYSKFTARAANYNNTFTIGKWSFVLTFSNGELSIPQTVYEKVYNIVNFDNATLYVTILLDDFDSSKLIRDSVKIEYAGQSIFADEVTNNDDSITLAIKWNKISHWFRDGQNSIEVTVSGNCTDGYSNFLSTGTVDRDKFTTILVE